MKLISYNLHKHNAVTELVPLAERHAPDALCLQEADTRRLPQAIGDLRLVRATGANRLGLAVYLSADRFDPRDVRVMSLEKSLHDRVMKPADERLVMVRAYDAKHATDVTVASFHAAPLTARNSLRRQQISTAFAALEDLGGDIPAVMVGDFNYPLFQERLRRHLDPFGYRLTRGQESTYSRYRVLRGNYDFAVSRGFRAADVTTLPQGGSDHLPILVRTSVSAVSAAPLASGPRLVGVGRQGLLSA